MPARCPKLSFPTAVLGLLLGLWVALGAWICLSAPFGSGTDESIRYVAFTAAKNRWATAEDAVRYGIDHAYYPPLYYLLFAPFFGDEPSFTTGYPLNEADFLRPVRFHGGRQILPPDALARVPAELLRLYRAAKVASLLLGVGVIVCVAASLRLLFGGPERDWLVLGGTAPLLLLPQFLYYQTLVNNDALVNFLCALALLCFVAAAGSHARGDKAAALRQAVACAGAVGLGLLTKQSAAALLPLLPALAGLEFRRDSGHSGRTRLTRVVGRLGLLSVVCLAAGGWWLVRSALAGDITGLKAQAISHPWAFDRDGLSWFFVSGFLGSISRTYLALFAGDFYSIPDWVFLAYLTIASILLAAFVCVAVIRLAGRPRATEPVRPGDPWRFVRGVLAGTVMLNFLMVFFYNLKILAPHGRLLFPSLVAGHTLLAAGISAVAGGNRRRLAAMVGALAISLGGLFLWTFIYRMVPAVLQPDKLLVVLGFIPGEDPLPLYSLWGKQVAQPLCLPPGRITGFRTPVANRSALPQFGTVILPRLKIDSPGLDDREYGFLPCSVGNGNGRDCWVDLVLEQPVDLREPTAALLQLEAREPWFRFPGLDFGYMMMPLSRSALLKPFVVNGAPFPGFGLPLTAVYERLEPDAIRRTLRSPCAVRR